MIFRLSQKLAKKIKEDPSQSLPPDPNPFADWSAHLFTADRTQYIIVTNTPSLYSAVMYGRGISDDSQFIRRALDCLREFMVDDGLDFIYRRFVAPATGTVRFSKALNRSVTGSMNDLIQCGKLWLTESGLSPFDTSFKLNEMPMSFLKYGNPREAFVVLKVGQPEDA
ncbi:hypothetical protein LCGC14_2990780 [marine sediment metagenome]|uniref:DUF6933 domain-containing protein n=1 Tax=marine sediment metagenome TaxID=412755 RepID=A0A0F8X3U3_9ZZZZ